MAAVADSISDAIRGEAQSAGGYTGKNGAAVDLEKFGSNLSANVISFRRADGVGAGPRQSEPPFVDKRIAQRRREINGQNLRMPDIRAEIPGWPRR